MNNFRIDMLVKVKCEEVIYKIFAIINVDKL